VPDTATAVDISKALTIKGFMHHSELTWLAEQASTHERIAEVGAYYGRSTRALCDNTSGKVHTYDDFWGPRDIVLDWRTRTSLREEFNKNLADHIESGRLIVHGVDHGSVEPAGLFDLIFIDGSHEYFEFKKDLETWIPYLTPDGTISGHDYDLGYPGVLRALAEVLGDGHFALVPDTTIWYARRNDAAR
jgi:hypothetical protein